ncbi:MAG: hypothetical protein KKA73_24555 [Chloroflexi bacterium]|nr:hypothetical protein [Chloroflexota bacterium]MBU1750866.1 hypothetical protein [Chloroflexota bacterium]
MNIKKSLVVAILTAILALVAALPPTVQAAPSPTTPTQGQRVAYASGALYSAPYGRGTYKGWTYGQRVLQYGTGGWYYTAAGWVQGTVTYQWTGGLGANLQAGLSYWGSYGQAPAVWW